MKKFFMARVVNVQTNASSEEISKYRDSVIEEMIKLGATQQEISFLKLETILNSLRYNRDPEDVAWAILQ